MAKQLKIRMLSSETLESMAPHGIHGTRGNLMN
jgi:hypothetical protein